MCDTILAVPSTTAKGVMLFGKNSDRYRNEAQAVEHFPRADWETGAQVRCTYISIPQVARTHAVLICRPFWTWGAEMGSNEHGVVIGNEGLRARSPAPTVEALIGMDLLRLTLERGSSAAEAVRVLTNLLERYGQGGNCGHLIPSYYQNGFMIADGAEAFVVETLDREWVVERVRGVRTMSNVYSVGSEPEMISPHLKELVHSRGWSDDASPNYALAIADPQSQHIGDSAARRARSTALLELKSGRLDALYMMRVLRDHGGSEQAHDYEWHPREARSRTLCLHAGSDAAPTQTTGSLVSEIGRRSPIHWVTATAAPCISIFKPVLPGVKLPLHGPPPTDHFDPATLWWQHEQLHRAAVLADFPRFLAEVAEERDAIEADFQKKVYSVLDGGDVSDRYRVVEECWSRALQLEAQWCERVSALHPSEETPFRSAWHKMNRLAGLALVTQEDAFQS